MSETAWLEPKSLPWTDQGRALFRTTRPLSSLVAGTLASSVLVAAYERLSLQGLAAGLAMTLLTMFGFVTNDIFDRRKDAAAGVQRPIATGELSLWNAIILANGLLVPVFLISKLIGPGGQILAITGLSLVAYSPIAQRFPLSKGICVAVLACTPMIYGSVVGGVQCFWFSYASLSCFVLGREILMDSDKFIGDRLSGLRTIAVVLGCNRARRIGTTLMFLSTACVVAMARGSVGKLAAVAALVSLALVFLWPNIAGSQRIQMSRVPMLLGAVAVAITQ